MAKRRAVKCSPPSVEDALRVLTADYREEINSLVEDAKRGLKSGDISDLNDWIHETIDGHERIIYTYKARIVMVCTENPDAYRDDMGQNPEKVEVEAFYAMAADLRDALSREGVEE
jgi:hypothetical protein